MIERQHNLAGVHPDLVKVVEKAGELWDEGHIMVLEGVRNLDRQRELVNAGASMTMKSRHLTGHAVDLAPVLAGEISWHWPHYRKLAAVVKQAASEVGVEVEWGGDWRSFKDGPHWQLPDKTYPA